MQFEVVQQPAQLQIKSVCVQANSSIGRVSVSKTEGWGFETLLACQCMMDLIP